MIDVIETALLVNNSVALTRIPYHYLTRPYTEPLMPLDRLSMKIQMNHPYQPFIPCNMEDSLKTSYQVMCKDHMKALLENFDIIYVSFNHFSDYIKDNFKEFYYTDMYKQFHLVFRLVDWDDEGLDVEIILQDKKSYMRHQYVARQFETNFNLQNNLKPYITCPCCFPTMAGTALYYKEKLPTKLTMIDSAFAKAFVLVRNDRIGIENICKVALLKWKCHNDEDYEKYLMNMGKKHKWQYNNILSELHKTHYAIIKTCESVKEKQCHSWKSDRNTNSPSWRSNIKVQ